MPALNAIRSTSVGSGRVRTSVSVPPGRRHVGPASVGGVQTPAQARPVVPSTAYDGSKPGSGGVGGSVVAVMPSIALYPRGSSAVTCSTTCFSIWVVLGRTNTAVMPSAASRAVTSARCTCADRAWS